jgi:DNA-3-methyladenine glycosylase II
VDDLGVRKGFQVSYGLQEMPGAAECVALGEKWRPWRTVGTWYLWRGLGQGEEKKVKRKDVKT